jgi:hypothetical protein
MFFYISQQSASQFPSHVEFEGHGRIEVVPSFRMLGVWLDSRLTFTTHIQHLHRDLSPLIAGLHRQKRHLSLDTMKMAFHSLLMSKILYCIDIWYGSLSSASRGELTRLWKRCVRLMIRSPQFNASTKSFCKTHRIWSLQWHYLVRLHAKTIRKMNTNDTRITKFLSRRGCRRFVLPKFNTSFYRNKSVLYNRLRLYNELPKDLRNITISSDSVKTTLNRYASESQGM